MVTVLMRCQGDFVLVVFVLGTLFFQLFSPLGGYAFVVGDSMDPTIPAGCSIVAAHSWDGESALTGRTVAFRSNQLDYAVGPSMLSTEAWVGHRVVAEYDPYDMDDANHYVSEEGLFIIEREAGTTKIASNQGYEEAKALEGERVLVLKGDNNKKIDPVLVHEDNVLGVLNEEASVTIQGAESWPCAAIE